MPAKDRPAWDMAHISRLTNLNDINRLLHETIVKERAIDAELDRQLQKRSELERNILVLNAATSEVRYGVLKADPTFPCGVCQQ